MNHYLLRAVVGMLRMSGLRPGRAFFLVRTLFNQVRAARRRARWEKQGIHVPPYMIASVTGKCNLQCANCYAKDLPRKGGQELSAAEWEQVFRQARDLGTSIVIVAGGEPFTKPGLIDAMARFPEIVFPVFTNGLLLDDGMLAQLARHKNILPIVSLEGAGDRTDLRRGSGVFDSVVAVMEKLRARNILFGSSLTVTRTNFDEVTGEGFVRTLIGKGCMLLFFIEYVPISANSEGLVVTEEQRSILAGIQDGHPAAGKAVLIAFPGNEDIYGGCLAAGRGFIHISAQGGVEPCPFAPYSDTNVRQVPLKDALQSAFLRSIRARHHLLSERVGGCALWKNRETIAAWKTAPEFKGEE